MKSRRNPEIVFDEKALQKELLHEAKAVGIAMAAAEVISLKVAQKVAAHLAKRAAVTVDDFNRLIASEAEKYSKDLAYVYKNRGKII